MKIETSLDWDNVSNELIIQLNSISYNPDLRKMLKNIEVMVGQLSKLEVEARRTRHTSYSNEQKDKINKAIDHLEKLLLMAKLMS
jgi:coenzyme F420-reducing hydrogenase delta subunit